MQVDLSGVLTTLGSTAVVVAAIAWLARALVGQYLSRDIENYRTRLSLSLKSHEAALDERAAIRLADIDQRAKVQLAEQQHAFNLELKAVEARGIAGAARADRIRQEIERWASPILGAVRDLRSRLENLLERDGYRALSASGGQAGLPKDWAITRDYLLSTTVFLFSQYFCWVRLLEERLKFDLFVRMEDKDRFFSGVHAVGDTLSKWPYPDVTKGAKGQDSQVFRLQQRALGESLIIASEGTSECMRLSEFLEKWREPAFRRTFEALETLIDGVSPGTPQWARVGAMLERLRDLDGECRKVLALPD